MKKITLMLIALLCAVVTFAAGPKKQFTPLQFTPAKANVQIGQQLNAKPAPKGLALKAFKNSMAISGKARAPKKAVAAADLAGDYLWDYESSKDGFDAVTPETMTTTAGSSRVVITATEVDPVWVASKQGYGSPEDVTDITIDEYTKGTFAAGSNTTNSPKYYDTGTAVRMYVGNTLTITSEKKIATIELTFVGANYSYLKVGEDDIALANNVGTWTGEANEVVFTVPTKESAGTTSNPQARIQEIKVTYVASEGEESVGAIAISGMFDNDLTATIGTDEDYGDYILIKQQLGGTSSYGDYVVDGLFYHEGDEDHEAGYYFSDEIYGWFMEDGTIHFSYGFIRILSSGEYAGSYLTPYFVEGSTLTPVEPLTPVVAPEGLVTDEYSITARNYKDDADVNGSVQIGFDGNDVYVQGLCTWIPEAWVKGTLDGTTITFATGQYLGNYYDEYDMFLNVLMGEDVVFDYDAEAGTLTAQNEYFLIDNSEYYFDSYRGCVLKKVIEKAVMPANPQITNLKNGSYGWYFNFNVPTVDVNGDGLATTKLAYMIYTDIEGEIAPLTFTPDTHTRLTEAITEIPYGFTENYDFYTDQIYLNDLYSADWNNLGIQSIYYGGGETNATEIQWFPIEAAPEVVVLPEGLEAETWYFSATASKSNVRNQEVAVAIDGSDIYIQGLNVDYLPEAWVKGTIDSEAGTATFPSGQYFGAFEYEGNDYDMFFVGYDATTKEVVDVVFTIDNEAGTMTTDQMIIINGKKDEVSYYEYYDDVVISKTIPEAPDLVVLPEGVETEDWTIDGTFADNYGSNNIVRATEVAFDGTDIYVKGIPFYFEDAWMKGTIDAESGIATFPTGQFVGEDEYGWEFMVGSDDFETLCDIEFAYDAEAKTLTQLTSYIIENGDTPDKISAYGYWTDMIIYEGEPIYEEAIEAPEDLVTETYMFKATELDVDVEEEEDLARVLKAEGEEEAVTFDFNSLGTEEEPWPVSSNDSHDGDITEALTLTEDNVTLTISPKEEGKTTENRFWGTKNGPQLRVYSGTLTFDVPEGYEMTQIVFNHNGNWDDNKVGEEVIPNDADAKAATWTGEAQSVVVTIAGNSQINSIAVTVAGGAEPEIIEYTHQMQVGFDGNDVYFKGVSDDTNDMWLKGTLSEDGKTVTIPANQYMGDLEVLWFTFPYYFTAVGEDGETMEDIVLNWDAENSTFTTDQLLVLHDGKRALGEPYQAFIDVEITKMEEFAATPADPSIDEYKLEGTSYPYVAFVIPAEDVDGNELLTSKLFYTVWIEEGNAVKPYVVTAGVYKYVEEDMTEIPYDYDDSYDIYKGGSRFYFNPTDVISAWTKIGVQSIYYGGGERNESSIVWMENPVYDPTVGIVNVNADGKQVIYFDLQGRRVAAPAKGLYIANGKKVVIK